MVHPYNSYIKVGPGFVNKDLRLGDFENSVADTVERIRIDEVRILAL
jgi:hypothetical protein